MIRAACSGAVAVALVARGLAAQTVKEFGVEALGTWAAQDFVGGGVYGALRVSAETRLAGTIAAGARDGGLAGRAELLLHFLPTPRSVRGPGIYPIGGVAAVVGGGDRDRGYLVAGLGVEERPGARAGWALELGVGGGLRLALGYRWRRFGERAGNK